MLSLCMVDGLFKGVIFSESCCVSCWTDPVLLLNVFEVRADALTGPPLVIDDVLKYSALIFAVLDPIFYFSVGL
jgi:hypothetical protein